MRHPSLRAEKSWYRISNFNVDLRVGYYWFKMTAYSPAFFARKSVSASFENYLSDLENFKKDKGCKYNNTPWFNFSLLLPYSSRDISLENLVLDQLMIS